MGLGGVWVCGVAHDVVGGLDVKFVKEKGLHEKVYTWTCFKNCERFRERRLCHGTVYD